MHGRKTSSRRHFLQSGVVLPVAAGLSSGTGAAAPAKSGIYTRLGIRPFINAVGTLTTLGGSLMPPQVVQAMEEASHQFVHIHELQEKVRRRIAELTGAEAAFVTAGASVAVSSFLCRNRRERPGVDESTA